MRQLVVAVVCTVAGVGFGMANSHHVELFYLLGEPVRIRLIFLLGIAFLTGVVSTWLYTLFLRMKERQQEARVAAVFDDEEDLL